MVKNKKSKSVDDNGKKMSKSKVGVLRTALLASVLGLLACAVVGLSVALYFSTVSVRTHESYQRQMDAVYFRTYYDLIDGANDMGITLKKLSASSSPELQREMLYDVSGKAALAESALGVFDCDCDGLMRAQKFVNQLGDYSHSLALRLDGDDALSDGEKATLAKLGEVAQVYADSLKKAGDGIDDGRLFVGDGGALESFSQAFSAFEAPDFDYPEMIYDGPFSDALENPQPKMQLGEEITSSEGAELAKKYFACLGVKSVSEAGEGGGSVETYCYNLSLPSGEAFAQLTKKGGVPVAFNMSGADDVAEAVRQEAGEECKKRAIDFAAKLGFENMQAVWSSSGDGICTVNLAPVQDGVILYPDLVKVKLVESGSKVIGLDATHYVLNHCARRLPTPAITAEQAGASIKLDKVSEGRLALIPMRGTREALTYEFECQSDGTYFVYIDAVSGKEVNILYVIDEQGMGRRTI